MRRAADGSYHVQFLVVDTQGHRVEAWEENGVWLAKDTLYATEAQRHSGEQTGKMTPFTTPIQDFYHIINLDQDHFHYVGLQSGNEYTVERIPDDVGFEQLPPSLTGIQVITQ
jgi:hypothetical protein